MYIEYCIPMYIYIFYVYKKHTHKVFCVCVCIAEYIFQVRNDRVTQKR